MHVLDHAARQTGADLRALRKLRGRTIAEVAKALGRSSGWLSQVERGHSRVSAEQLQRFAQVLQVSPTLLLTHTSENAEPDVVRAGQRRPYGRRAAGLQEELATPGLDCLTEVRHARFEPRSARVTARRSAAEEIIHILSGRLIISTQSGRTDLRRGDTIRLRDMDFAWENPSGAMATALWITSAPRY